LKPERWGTPLRLQEKYQREKACENRYDDDDMSGTFSCREDEEDMWR
jgi:hypothetical protein